MEVQAPQSVQINFNNKIITLHNVTIVKNPKIITIDASQYSNFLKGSPVKLNNAASATTPPVKIPINQLALQALTLNQKPLNNSFVLNPIPAVKQAPNFGTQVIRTIPKNLITQFKRTPVSISSPTVIRSPINLQTLAVKQQKPTTTVIISPTKVSTPNVNNPIKVQLKGSSEAAFSYVISKQPNASNAKQPNAPIAVSQAPAAVNQAKVIITTNKNKTSPCEITPPDAKKQCKQLEFHCIFCKDVYEDSNQLVNHIKLKHPESLENKQKEEVKPQKEEIDSKATLKDVTKPALKVEQPEVEEEEKDDDESEVNDLIMDIEETQDTAFSNQERSETPESPEFEEHVPSARVKPEPVVAAEVVEKSNDDEYDYEDYEYFSNIMEPICELSCEEDSNDGLQGENEAMRLYREAMEVNYQQNGIKKRGRRKQRKPKPLVENTTSMNGILAGLLENSTIKVPPGPGRGRRKEIDEKELEMDRSNGICLFSCNKCDESFKYAGDLAKHVRSHTISSPFQCSICQRKFTHIGSLNTHLRIHSGERPYKCNQCDKSFTQSNSLMVHVKSHLSNKPFQCLQCNKGFLNASSLALHTKTHTGPTSVLCPIDTCGKEFRDNNLLEEHMVTHRQSMLYQCSLCSEKFEQSCLLVQHVKSHIGDKPFQCNQCGKCFTQPGSLNTHLRIHTGEKPFECNICGKKFTQASSLSVHMKVHGEKEYKCALENCKKSYSQEAYLKKHMLKHIEMSLNDENNHIAQE